MELVAGRFAVSRPAIVHGSARPQPPLAWRLCESLFSRRCSFLSGCAPESGRRNALGMPQLRRREPFGMIPPLWSPGGSSVWPGERDWPWDRRYLVGALQHGQSGDGFRHDIGTPQAPLRRP